MVAKTYFHDFDSFLRDLLRPLRSVSLVPEHLCVGNLDVVNFATRIVQLELNLLDWLRHFLNHWRKVLRFDLGSSISDFVSSCVASVNQKVRQILG